MHDCTNKHFKDMLHAFELGMLEQDDCRELEIHLYECESCFEKAKKFQNVASLLRADIEVRNSLHEIDADQQKVIERSKKVVKSGHAIKGWKGKTLYALAAVIVIAIAIPVYQSGILIDKSTKQLQQLYLNPLRGSGDNVINLNKAKDVEIRFVVESAKPGTIVQIRISPVDGEIIFLDDRFADFNTAGQGTLMLPLTLFDSGHHMLIISDTTGNYLQSDIQYIFRVE